MAYVEGEDILAQARAGSTPSEADSDWADLCAAAVDAAIVTKLGGYTVADDSPAAAELARCALLDGIAAYADRDAPAGILSMGPDGAPVRVRTDVLRACIPVIARYVLPGIG